MSQSSMVSTTGLPKNPLLLLCDSEARPFFPSLSDPALSPMLAGYVAGNIGVLIGHPLDSLKVLEQTGTTRVSNLKTISTTSSRKFSTSRFGPVTQQSRTFATSLLPSTHNTGATLRSLASLYSGVSTPLATAGLLNSINFYVYDSVREHLYNSKRHVYGSAAKEYRDNDSILSVGIAGVTAGSVISIMTSPLAVIKTKQQIMLWKWKEAARNTLSLPGGVRNFYVGFGAHYYCNTVGRVSYFCTYELLKRGLMERRKNGDKPTKSLPLLDRIACAAVSGAVCWATIYPVDAIQARMYSQSAMSSSSISISKMITQMYKNGGNGFSLFYRGFGPTVLRAMPISAATLPAYDAMLAWFSEM